MSRAYRVRVRETLRRVIRAEDHVGTMLELLEILPPEAMADLLRRELIGRGFVAEGESLVRRGDGVTVAVDPASGSVTVRAEASEDVELEASGEGVAYEELRRKRELEEQLREEARVDLERKAGQKADELRRGATDRLEAELLGLRAELDGVVNRVTAEALKRKAAQIGQIKEMTEDPRSGSLTIVLEV
jgi:hypothetical protein